jgi:calcineurin-like phosphoesterase family protein
MSIKITAADRGKLFFTSDQHYGHENVIRFCGRPFRDAAEMNDELVRLHNERVPKDGIVFHLGDFAFSKVKSTVFDVFPRLHGARHHLIVGNHEKAVTDNPRARALFTTVSQYEDLYVEEDDGTRQLLCLFHYPIHEWNKQHHAAWHLHGHTHNTVKPDARFKRMDAGVDNPLAAYGPLSYEAVRAFMATCAYTPLDKEKVIGAGA